MTTTKGGCIHDRCIPLCCISYSEKVTGKGRCRSFCSTWSVPRCSGRAFVRSGDLRQQCPYGGDDRTLQPGEPDQGGIGNYSGRGQIGQVLYLQAEMSRQNGSALGCSVDDPAHRLFRESTTNPIRGSGLDRQWFSDKLNFSDKFTASPFPMAFAWMKRRAVV